MRHRDEVEEDYPQEELPPEDEEQAPEEEHHGGHTELEPAHERRRRSNPLPWILLGVTAAVLVIFAVLVMRQLNALRAKADSESIAHADQVVKVERAELAAADARARVGTLEEQVRTLTDERDQLAKKLSEQQAQPKASEVATAKPAPTKATAAKKPPKKKKRK